MNARLCVLGLAFLIAVGGGASRGQDEKKDEKKPEHPVQETYRKKLREAEEAYLKVRDEVRKELVAEEKKAQEAVDKARAEMNKAFGDLNARKPAIAAYQKAIDELFKVRRLRFECEHPKMIGLPSPAARLALEGGRLGAKYTGQINEALRTQLGLEKGKGQLITSVVKDRAAEKAGLKVHDVLLKLDGKDVPGDYLGFRKLLEGIKGGDTPVEAVIVRQGKQQTVKITLSEEKDQPSRVRPPRLERPKKKLPKPKDAGQGA
jgi:C-terminal processing protease CtpA/Prc